MSRITCKYFSNALCWDIISTITGVRIDTIYILNKKNIQEINFLQVR